MELHVHPSKYLITFLTYVVEDGRKCHQYAIAYLGCELLFKLQYLNGESSFVPDLLWSLGSTGVYLIAWHLCQWVLLGQDQAICSY